MTELPIDAVIPECLDALRSAAGLVLHAPPGAGKTTRLPPALMDSPLSQGGRVIVLEPRRIAARTAAKRISAERGEQLGQSVGYRIRFEQCVSRDTRLEVVTEGILLRRLLDDPFLDGVSVVVFDEFHERRVDSDLALAMTRHVQQTVRPDLKIVVMSATLAPQQVAEWLGDCRIISSAGRQFPVRTEYVRRMERTPLPDLAAAGVAQVLDRTDGDVLVFLPGVGEIFRTQRELEPLARRHDLLVLPLFGEMTSAEQDRVLAPAAQRRVVLATNVAETSLTIDGITAVVDTGVARQLLFCPDAGIDRLELTAISRASADQRAGRAGRTAPGFCLRLWDESTHRHRPEFETAELHRVDLSAAVLRLQAWGEASVREFPWYERPSDAQLDAAERLLQRLGAVNADGVTRIGQAMARMPVHPRLARLLIEAADRGVLSQAALLAAMLTERDPFREPGGERAATSGTPRTLARRRSSSDVLDRVLAFEEFLRSGRTEFDIGNLAPGTARSIQRTAQQLERLARQNVPSSPVPAPIDSDEPLLQSVALAFTDRIARRREPGSDRGIMVGGRGVRLHARSAVREPAWFVCVDLDGKGADATVRLASEVRLEWLPESLFGARDELFFHPSQKKVVARRIRSLEDLVIEETPVAVTDTEAAAEILWRALRTQLTELLSAHDEAARFVARVNCAGDWCPDAGLPRLDDAGMEKVFKSLCRSCRSRDELKQANWLAAVQTLFDGRQLQIIERMAPDRIVVPGGSRIRLVYEPGRPPILAVKIQDAFGLKETPRVADGRVPVLMHLLAPNQRVQQVTDDLASFWSVTYHTVRKELKRRYPKHHWPEDPLTATAPRRQDTRA